jgi:hypothetical protein
MHLCIYVFVGPAPYDANENGTNVCRPGYLKITTTIMCVAAAEFLGCEYFGIDTDAAFPSGCYVTPTDVRLNLDATGAGYSVLRPLCIAGKNAAGLGLGLGLGWPGWP